MVFHPLARADGCHGGSNRLAVFVLALGYGVGLCHDIRTCCWEENRRGLTRIDSDTSRLRCQQRGGMLWRCHTRRRRLAGLSDLAATSPFIPEPYLLLKGYLMQRLWLGRKDVRMRDLLKKLREKARRTLE